MPISGLVIIDEVQRGPDRFPLLRMLTDRVEVVPLATPAEPGGLFAEAS